MDDQIENKKREIKDYIISLVNNNELEEAKELINEYNFKVQNDIEIYSILSIIFIYENKLSEAEKILRDGLKLEINNVDLLYNLAYLYECTDLKCLPLALNYYKRCFESSKNEEFKKDIQNIIVRINSELVTVDETNRPLVSIVLLAYNKLEYTKLCVESIYKYTSNIKFELITVNNGSSDDTKLYFDSLSNSKKIDLINNVRPVDGFNAGIELAEGKYTACICNDFIFTVNWLGNLLKCIESDESIGFVSPGANIVSNYQQINSNYNTIDELEEFAENYNVSDPKKWEERIRLLPCVLLCKSELLKNIVGYDSRFYFGDFADDDISFRIRRAGYKLIYARDTFVHHFGSVTVKEDHIENNSLEISRKIFIDKYHIDTRVEATFNPAIVSMVKNKNKENASILGINSFCGGTPLQIKNELKSVGVKSVKITNITENKKYIQDLKTVSDEAHYSSGDNLLDCICDKKYDFIVYENGIDNVHNICEIFGVLKNSLNKDGQLIFTMYNEAYYEKLFYINQYEQTLYGDEYKISYLNLNKIVDMLLSKKFNNIKINRVILPYKHEMISNMIKVVSDINQEEFRNNITTFKFIISCEI